VTSPNKVENYSKIFLKKVSGDMLGTNILGTLLIIIALSGVLMVLRYLIKKVFLENLIFIIFSVEKPCYKKFSRI